MTRLFACLIVFCLALLPEISSARVDKALAGKMVVTKIQNGQQTDEYAKNGQLIYEVIERQKTAGGNLAIEAVEREWRADGTPIRDQTFLGGKEIKGSEWYMNGKLKEKRLDQSIHEPEGLPGVYVRRFSDLGVIQSEGVYQDQYRRVGAHREYDEKGILKREITYGRDGQKIAAKVFDASGAKTAGAEYFPDGSRKLD